MLSTSIYKLKLYDRNILQNNPKMLSTLQSDCTDSNNTPFNVV